MRTRLKLGATAAVFLLGVAALSKFFDWMNLPSDRWFWTGAFSALALVLVVSAAMAAIWRPDFQQAVWRWGTGRRVTK